MTKTDSLDEVGVVTRAFNTMVESLGRICGKNKRKHGKEQQMMEKELLMKNHLKEAQLKYLQSQINPHFLFNSLNAGVQLAMMEDAEKTCIFVEKMADFFRYNVKKGTGRRQSWRRAYSCRKLYLYFKRTVCRRYPFYKKGGREYYGVPGSKYDPSAPL